MFNQAHEGKYKGNFHHCSFLLQPVENPLSSDSAILGTKTSPQFSAVHKLAESAIIPDEDTD